MGLAQRFAESIEREFFLKCGLLIERKEQPVKQKTTRQRKGHSNRKNLKDLLDSLDESFFIMQHARPYIRHNPAFAFGAHVVWQTDKNEGWGSNYLEFFDHLRLPSAFMVLFHPKRTDDYIPALLIAEKKSSKIQGVEYTKDTVYHFGRVYVITDSPDGKPLKKPEVFYDNYYVAVSESGKVRALKKKQPSISCSGGSRFYDRNRWQYPHLLTEAKNTSGITGIEELFCVGYNLHSRRACGCEIYAERKLSRLVFAVPDNDFKTFFSDRIPVVVDGIKKRILHWVKAHTRQKTTGETSCIRSHLRGLTDFTWKDTHIKIRLDGHNSLNSSSFDLTPLPDDVTRHGVQVSGDTLFNAVVS